MDKELRVVTCTECEGTKVLFISNIYDMKSTPVTCPGCDGTGKQLKVVKVERED
jgi:DnaJ-class molecular chaperone